MTETRDLDILVPDPKTVKFGGKEFKVPADIPMEIFLRINRAGQAKDEEGNSDQLRQVEQLTDAIADLFCFEREELPDFSEDEREKIRDHVRKTLSRRGVRFTFQLISTIYREDDEDDAEKPEGGAEDPTEVPVQTDAALSGTTSSST